jgi:hypothetical protein
LSGPVERWSAAGWLEGPAITESSSTGEVWAESRAAALRCLRWPWYSTAAPTPVPTSLMRPPMGPPVRRCCCSFRCREWEDIGNDLVRLTICLDRRCIDLCEWYVIGKWCSGLNDPSIQVHERASSCLYTYSPTSSAISPAPSIPKAVDLAAENQPDIETQSTRQLSTLNVDWSATKTASQRCPHQAKCLTSKLGKAWSFEILRVVC